jgi:DNA-binding CsgD family transcriptional regulator/transcriptional regulator with GAF, ATPase, and Fis domain
LSADAIRQAVLRIADSRSLATLRDALFDKVDALIGGVAMGFYLFDRAEELRHVASRLAPQGFLEQYDREYRRIDPMLDCIVSQKRTVDGFHFHGPSDWKHCGNYDILRDWGFHHNMGGPLVINGRTAGVLFVATSLEENPFADVHVKRLDLMCRAASLALTAMRERERLSYELSDQTSDVDYDPCTLESDLSESRALSEGRPIDRLPARSREVATLVCQGQPNKVIAHRLGISIYTVKEHVQILCRRFGAVNRTELVHHLLKSS